jgi:hypothetical protein
MKHYLVKLLMAVVFVAFGFAAGGQVTLTTVAEAWQFLPQSGPACDEEDLSFDYGIGGGMRNFFCRALTIYSWQAFLASAPVGNPPDRPKAREVEFSTKEFLREEVKIYRQPDHGCAQTG